LKEKIFEKRRPEESGRGSDVSTIFCLKNEFYATILNLFELENLNASKKLKDEFSSSYILTIF